MPLILNPKRVPSTLVDQRSRTSFAFMNRGAHLSASTRRGVVPPVAQKATSSSPSPAHRRGNTQPTSALTILVYVPNVICYGRLLLLAAASVAAASSRQLEGILLVLLNIILDGVDGAAARRLGQTSSFGAFLDVAVDLSTRGLVWSWAAPGGLGTAVLLLEAITFTCTHAASGPGWRDAAHFASAPAFVRAVMANGFKTPAGCLAVAGLMGCPLWLWARRVLRRDLLWCHPLLGAPLVLGRLLAAAVEVWVVGSYLRALLQRDVAAGAAAATLSARAVGDAAGQLAEDGDGGGSEPAPAS